MTVVQIVLDVAYPNMEAFRRKKEVVDTQRRKVTDKSLSSWFEPIVKDRSNSNCTVCSGLRHLV